MKAAAKKRRIRIRNPLYGTKDPHPDSYQYQYVTDPERLWHRVITFHVPVGVHSKYFKSEELIYVPGIFTKEILYCNKNSMMLALESYILHSTEERYVGAGSASNSYIFPSAPSSYLIYTYNFPKPTSVLALV
jgi:hypothetical protein